MPYTVLANSYGISVYQFQGHARQLQLPYNSHRTCLTNRIESISHHIMPLVINSLGSGHTQTYTHTYRRPHKNNFKKPGTCQCMPGLKITVLPALIYHISLSIHTNAMDYLPLLQNLIVILQ